MKHIGKLTAVQEAWRELQQSNARQPDEFTLAEFCKESGASESNGRRMLKRAFDSRVVVIGGRQTMLYRRKA